MTFTEKTIMHNGKLIRVQISEQPIIEEMHWLLPFGFVLWMSKANGRYRIGFYKS